MSFAALIDLRDSLDTMLQQIRSERHISSPVFTYPKWGLRGVMAEPRVSVRAMILALRSFGVALHAKTKALEREWSRYRDEQGLDLYGKSLLFESLSRETNEYRCIPGGTTLLEYGFANVFRKARLSFQIRLCVDLVCDRIR